MAPVQLHRRRRLRSREALGFTLIETLVAISALVLMLGLMLSITTYVSKTVIAGFVEDRRLRRRARRL